MCQTTQELKDALKKRNPRSEAVWKRAQMVYPHGQNTGTLDFPPFPFYASRAQGAYIWDLDDNRYLDICMTYGVHILGHAPEVITRELHKQMDNGMHYAAPYEREVEFAEKFTHASPCSDKLIMCNSGTEAVLKAIAIARASTGRNRIAKFEGGFHGPHEYSQWSCFPLDPKQIGPIESPKLVQESLGMPRDIEDSLLLLPFNDENAFRLIEDHANDLAAVIIEPVLVAYALPVEQNFFKRLREVTAKCGVLLIFDEVVTKYRIALGGGEEYFDITPDINAFGKAIGGGLPVGAVGCRSEVIDPITSGSRIIELGGTFSGNIMTITAAKTVLEYLLDHPEIYTDLALKGDTLRSEFNNFSRKHGYPATMTGVGSMFRVLFSSPPLHTPRECVGENPKLVRDFHLFLRLADIYTPYPLRTCYLSTAHNDEDVEYLIKTHQNALQDCMEMNENRLW